MLVEAMAAGTAVVASDLDAFPACCAAVIHLVPVDPPDLQGAALAGID